MATCWQWHIGHSWSELSIKAVRIPKQPNRFDIDEKFGFFNLHSSQKLRLQHGVMTASVNTRLHNGQRRSLGISSSTAFDELDIVDETFFSSDCRIDWARASCFRSLRSTYNSLYKNKTNFENSVSKDDLRHLSRHDRSAGLVSQRTGNVFGHRNEPISRNTGRFLRYRITWMTGTTMRPAASMVVIMMVHLVRSVTSDDVRHVRSTWTGICGRIALGACRRRWIRIIVIRWLQRREKKRFFFILFEEKKDTY